MLPHESRRGDRALTRALLRRVDFAITHSREEESLARTLGARDVRYAELPPHGPGATSGTTRSVGGAGLLFFGFIRPYKGVDVLLDAVATVPEARLVVAGESWEGEERLRARIASLGVADRVDLRLRYLDNDELDRLLHDADALVLPYTSGTGTQQVRVAQTRGLPVIATRIGTLPDQVTDGVDGFLVQPNDAHQLAGAIRRLDEPGRLDQMRAAVQPPDDEAPWQRYVAIVAGR